MRSLALTVAVLAVATMLAGCPAKRPVPGPQSAPTHTDPAAGNSSAHAHLRSGCPGHRPLFRF